MPHVQVTQVVDTHGTHAISDGMTVYKPFRLKGTDTSGHGGTASVNGPTFNSSPYATDSNGDWESGQFDPPSGSYSAFAICSDTMLQSSAFGLHVTT